MGFLKKLFGGGEDGELAVGSDVAAIAEQFFQLGVVAEVPIADHLQHPSFSQDPAGLLQHSPGDVVTGLVLLMKRRVEQYQIAAFGLDAAEPVVDQELGIAAAAKGGVEVGACARHRHIGFIAKQ